MNNYRIKVNNTHPKAYQEVLDIAAELGYANEDWGNLYNLNYLFLNEDGSVGFSLNGEAVSYEHQELTLPQLRDLVVLHRNDVKDATHTDGERKGFLSSDGVEYFWNVYDLEWFKAKQMTFAYEKFTPIKKEQGLISGADALRALADGKEIEWKDENGIWWALGGAWTWNQIINGMGGIEALRLKPRTIKLEIEIPVCGKNYKHGQLIWVLNSLEPKEYCSVILDESDELPAYWWETEEEIKQVVAAWRGGIKQ